MSRPAPWPLARRTQEFLHDPDAGTMGDCHRAAVASLLGFTMARVPHFALYGLDAERDVDQMGWWWAFVGWCASLEPAYTVDEGRLRDVDLPEPSDDPADLGGCYLLGGPSPRGVEHYVVARGGETVWDPHPSRDGLTEATSAVVLRRRPPGEATVDRDALAHLLRRHGLPLWAARSATDAVLALLAGERTGG